MTEHQVINPLSIGTDYEALAARFSANLPAHRRRCR